MNRAKLLLILIAIGAVALLAFRYHQRRSATATGRPHNSVNAFMESLADDAVRDARGRGFSLDGSSASVQHVETILAGLHDQRTRGQLGDRELNLLAHRYGAYIGQVLRRQYGGHWTKDHDVAGPGSFPIHWNDVASFPVGWCGKRLLDGPTDNVWHKYQVVSSPEALLDLPHTRQAATVPTVSPKSSD